MTFYIEQCQKSDVYCQTHSLGLLWILYTILIEGNLCTWKVHNQLQLVLLLCCYEECSYSNNYVDVQFVFDAHVCVMYILIIHFA